MNKEMTTQQKVIQQIKNKYKESKQIKDKHTIIKTKNKRIIISIIQNKTFKCD